MDQTKYYLCNVTAKLVTNTIEPSCFYQKKVIGKKGLRVSFQICVILFGLNFVLVITYNLEICLTFLIFTGNEPASPSTTVSTPRTTSMSTSATLTTAEGMYYFCAFANLWLNMSIYLLHICVYRKGILANFYIETLGIFP